MTPLDTLDPDSEEASVARQARQLRVNNSITIYVSIGFVLGFVALVLFLVLWPIPATLPPACNDACAKCEAGQPNWCSECVPGYFHQPDGRYCKSDCPLPYVKNTTSWECSRNTTRP